MPNSARILPFQAAHYIRKAVAFNTPGIDTGVAMNQSLPAGAIVHRCTVSIDTAFNAATTNVLTVGTVSTAYNNLLASGDVDETTTGVTTIISKGLKVATDTDVYIKYTQTGTAATAGAAVVEIGYSVNNDA